LQRHGRAGEDADAMTIQTLLAGLLTGLLLLGFGAAVGNNRDAQAGGMAPLSLLLKLAGLALLSWTLYRYVRGAV
jgi:hypothetical protein